MVRISWAILGLYVLLYALPVVAPQQSIPYYEYRDMDKPWLPWGIFDLIAIIFKKWGPNGGATIKLIMVVAVIAAILLVLGMIYCGYCLIVNRSYPGESEMEIALGSCAILTIIFCVAILVVNGSINAMGREVRSELSVTAGFHMWLCLVAALTELILVIPHYGGKKEAPFWR